MNGDLFEHKDPEAQSLTDVPTEQRGFFSLFTQPASASIGGSKVFAYLAWFAVSGRSAAGETPRYVHGLHRLAPSLFSSPCRVAPNLKRMPDESRLLHQRTTCTQQNMSEVWRISTAKSVRRSGIFNTSIRKEKSTTNPRSPSRRLWLS